MVRLPTLGDRVVVRWCMRKSRSGRWRTRRYQPVVASLFFFGRGSRGRRRVVCHDGELKAGCAETQAGLPAVPS